MLLTKHCLQNIIGVNKVFQSPCVNLGCHLAWNRQLENWVVVKSLQFSSQDWVKIVDFYYQPFLGMPIFFSYLCLLIKICIKISSHLGNWIPPSQVEVQNSIQWSTEVLILELVKLNYLFNLLSLKSNLQIKHILLPLRTTNWKIWPRGDLNMVLGVPLAKALPLDHEVLKKPIFLAWKISGSGQAQLAQAGTAEI